MIGRYEWRQGSASDRLVGNEVGDVSALDGYSVMPLVRPAAP